MSKGFNIRKGIYVVPNQGRVNCTTEVDNATAVALYLNPRFSFITLNKKGVALLKREKLSAKEVARLILEAKSVEEVDLLLEVKSNKTLISISETKKASLSL